MRRPLRRPALAALAATALLSVAGTTRTAPNPPPGSAAPPTRPSASSTALAPSSGKVAAAVKRLDEEMRRVKARAGAYVVDVETGAPLAALRETEAFNPASNAKLVTAALALGALGPRHRFVTGLHGSVGGERVGELVLRGHGDPTLTSAHLRELARTLRARGVRRVDTILVDQGFFDERFVPPAFEQQPTEWATFRANVAAVSVNGNAVTFTVRPGKRGEPASVAIDPPGFIDMAGVIDTAPRKSTEKVAVSLEPAGARLRARLGGHVPEAGREVVVARRVDDPRLLAGFALQEALRVAGISADGEVRLGGGGARELLASHLSAPLGEVVGALGKASDNFVAEMLLKAVAAEVRGRPGTSAAGAELARADLERLGALEDGVIVANGSGLFDANRTTPRALALLLRSASRDPRIGPEFVSHLSIGGVDGTLRGRFRSRAATRAVRAKTGTLAAVFSLSGYVLPPPGGRPVAFALLVNDARGHADVARSAMDRVVEAVADELWGGHR